MRLLLIPRPYLYGGILVFALIGVWGLSTSWVDLLSMVVIGVMGYVMRVYDFPIAPVLIGLILGPMAEKQLRQALAIAQGDPLVLVSSPIAASLLALAVVALLLPVVLGRLKREVEADDAAATAEGSRPAS